MGLSPISWTEINQYFNAIGLEWTWLAIQIKTLSNHYVDEFYLAKDTSRPSPYQELLDKEINRQAVKKQFANFVKAKRKV